MPFFWFKPSCRFCNYTFKSSVVSLWWFFFQMWFCYGFVAYLTYSLFQMADHNFNANILPRGHSTLGYVPCATKKTLLFFHSLSPKDPHFYQLSANDPLQTPRHQKTLTHLCHSKTPHFHLYSQTSDNFLQKFDFSKILTHFTKYWEIFSHFGPEGPMFWCISLNDPLFLCALSLKDPSFWHNLSPKDPYIWGAWWHSYVTFICECPPGYFILIVLKT